MSAPNRVVRLVIYCSAFFSTSLMISGTALSATLTQDAETLMTEQRYAEAASEYAKRVEKSPKDVKLRLRYAEALAYSRQWPQAIEQYKAVLQQDPKNSEAKRSLGSVYRWSGDIDNSIEYYNAALKQNPKDISAQLGLAATYRLDHDFKRTDEIYAQAEQQAPEDSSIKRNMYNFKRDKNPRVHGYFEQGLTSTTIYGGVTVPFLSREEIGYEYQDEIRTDIYTRSDHKVGYRHYFGFNHDFEFRYRASTFDYDNPVTAFAAIDTFDEFRIRYTFTVQHNNVVRIRYTWRPTSLKNSGDHFDSRKLEAEVRTFWNARLNTTLGGGWLRDLPEDASRASDLKNNALVNLGIEYLPDNDWGFSARYITNPDLDNSTNSTQILQVDYRINGPYSLLARYKVDDYKTSGDEISYFAGLRFVPNHHLWSELGMKYATRDGKDGTYPFLSLVWRL